MACDKEGALRAAFGARVVQNALGHLAWDADFLATYSSGRKKIVFGGSSDRTADLYMVDANGMHLKRLTSVGEVGDPYNRATGR